MDAVPALSPPSPICPPHAEGIPTYSEIHTSLLGMRHAQVQCLSALSGVPFATLWHIRSGKTTNPGIETVRRFWPHIKAASAETGQTPAAME
jgi:hypothetical protein